MFPFLIALIIWALAICNCINLKLALALVLGLWLFHIVCRIILAVTQD